MVKKILVFIIQILDFILIPFTLIAAIWLKALRAIRLSLTPFSKKIFDFVGMLPLREHFYEPLINPAKHLKKDLKDVRDLPGLNLNLEFQFELLQKFNYNEELLHIPTKSIGNERTYFYDNGVFPRGDGEYLYNIIRYFKPARIIEIGSGHSTLMMVNAIKQNKQENTNYKCTLNCVEPYMQPWLEDLGMVNVIRKKVEDIDVSFFQQLQKNDILFIDSSHIIRPQGDVLFEFLSILPQINPGVLIHVHDVFTPCDYLEKLLYEERRLWNEQYILEALLSENNNFEIIGALYYLKHYFPEKIYPKLPLLNKDKTTEPGSFWIRRK